jgi:hypothetical protein
MRLSVRTDHGRNRLLSIFSASESHSKVVDLLALGHIGRALPFPTAVSDNRKKMSNESIAVEHFGGVEGRASRKYIFL